MNDKEFFELQLRATIVPQRVRWPGPEHLHWQRLHEAAHEARERVRKAYLLMDEIDRKAELSRNDKYHQRGKAAAQAIADFEASKTLVLAREAVRYASEQWNRDDLAPEIAAARAATLKAMKEADAGWQKAIDKIAERASLTKKGPYTRR